jgi:hypothetical protein
MDTNKITRIMKNIALFLLISGCIYISSCKKESQSDSFKLLTGPIWVSDSLLANGFDASGPLGLLKNFKGEVKFNEDGTGNFGMFTGTWRFAFDETQIVITSDSLPIPLTNKIAELTATSLKITTSFPAIPPINIRMTFKPK